MRTIPISKLKDEKHKKENIMPTQEEFYEEIIHEINRRIKIAINNGSQLPYVALNISYDIFYGSFCNVKTINEVVKHFKEHGYNIEKQSDSFKDGSDKKLEIRWK